ncbi:Aldo/keto reductase [Hysterangium stoloniferum]|nr:Aldo/keto reductase [Hysterangium stoloniferum]
MGAMTFGREGQAGARVTTLDGVNAILDVFQKHGHAEVDSARVYTGGTSEEYLGEVNWQKRGLIGVREGLKLSLEALKADKIEIFYLHSPDRTTPWEVTFKACDDLYKEGKFTRLGISNYQSWEVAEIVTLCRANGWIAPTVYQGLYNAIHRAAEPELFPCLRKFGISFYEYNPLGGGFFTGRYSGPDTTPEPGSRFDTSKGTPQSTAYRNRYWNDQYFKALDIVRVASEKEGLTMAESALRWLNHHSILRKEHGDAVIIGASSVAHIAQNLIDLEKGPLPDSVVNAIDEAWDVVKGDVRQYWRGSM